MRFLGSKPVSDVDSSTGPKDTSDDSAQVESPCEDDVSRGLVDGRGRRSDWSASGKSGK